MQSEWNYKLIYKVKVKTVHRQVYNKKSNLVPKPNFEYSRILYIPNYK